MQTEIRNGTLYISGDVTVKTLTASAFARYEQQCRLKETDSIDFSQVGKADSACVSLLLNALRRTDKKTDHSKYSRFRPRTGRTLRNQRLVAIMKKTTASLCLLISIASAPALAERNPADPYEGYNRTVSKFNDKADKYVLSPVARGYRKITPKPVRTGVSNFFNNLRDVVSFGSNVLRLDVKRASEDLVRVGINTTFGLGGLIDVAGAGGVPSNKTPSATPSPHGAGKTATTSLSPCSAHLPYAIPLATPLPPSTQLKTPSSTPEQDAGAQSACRPSTPVKNCST